MLEISGTPLTPAAQRFTGRVREIALLGLFFVPLAILLAALAWRSTLMLPLNYNEGWNAYWASAAASGSPLYPPLAGLRVDNYPPLSFLLLGGLMHLGLDPIYAGRLLAWAAFAAVTALIAAVLRAFGDDRVAAGCGALLLAGYMATQYTNYIGVDDPQMLAHAIVCAGLLVAVRGGVHVRSAVLAAAVMAVGLFVKHSIVALPAALAVWLWVMDRRAGLAFAGTLAVCGLVGLCLCRLAFGPDFFANLTAPRIYSFAWAHRRVVVWLMPMLIPLLFPALLTMRSFRDRSSAFIAMFAALALLVGCASATGEGVSYSCMFELVIACALGFGHVIGRLGEHGERRTYAIAVAGLSVLFWAGTEATHDAIRVLPWMGHERAEASATRILVKRIAARPGPALCETPAYCFWAGKPYAVDIFNFNEALRRHRLGEDSLLHDLATGHFSSVQTNPAVYSYAVLPPQSEAMLHERYRLAAAMPGGNLYVPAQTGRSVPPRGRSSSRP